MSLIFAYDVYNPKSWKGRPTKNYLATTTYGQANCIGRSDRRPFVNAAHSGSFDFSAADGGFSLSGVGRIETEPEPPVGAGELVWGVEDSSPDNFSRFSPQKGFDIDDFDNLDVTHVCSVYVYIPPNITLGNSTLCDVIQNSTGQDWHNGSSSNTSSAGYNSTYDYWAFRPAHGQTKVQADTAVLGRWQRLHVPFVPSSTVRDQQSGSPRIDKLGGYFRPNLVGQSNQNFLYVAGSQLEEGSLPSPLVIGERTSAQALLDLVGASTLTIDSSVYGSDGYFDFDASEADSITVPNNATIQSKPLLSFECWIKPGAQSSQTNSFPRIFQKGTRLAHIANNTNGFTINLTCGGSLRQTTYSGNNHFDGNHHFYAFTYDGRFGKVYHNGELVKTQDFTSSVNIDADTSTMAFGNTAANGTSRPYEGKIDMFKMYDNVLTAAEIKRTYLATRARYD